jgi:anaerobic magnesium-protoporphyrin IX monomethyl ester cyclase
MAKVILLDSPSWLLFNPRQFLHLGILYLAGSLRAAGHNVKVCDCHEVTAWDAERRQLLIHHDKLEACDVLGISATTANVHWGQQLAKAWPAKVKVLGGSHATYILRGPHDNFKRKQYFDGFDFAIIEEAEENLVAFCDGFDRGDISGTPNLCWFNELGCLQRTPGHGSLPDVERLPGPAFDLWPSRFFGGGLSAHGHDKTLDLNEAMTASLYTARGCPYGCKFCADARTKVREETLTQIEGQVKQLAELGVSCIRIQDDVLTIKEERCQKLADILSDYGMRWRGNTRVNLTNPKLFDYMASKGCCELGFGVEHGSAKMLKLMAKGTTPEKNTEGIRMCQDAGMVAKAFLMIGFPGETLATIEEMKQWILLTRPSACSWCLFQPFPGSDVWNNPQNYDVKLPENAFSRFWQQGLEGTEDELVLDLPTISKAELLRARREVGELIDLEIGHRDRRRVDAQYYGEAVMM